MPHKNHKIQKMEDDTLAVIKESGHHHKGKNHLDRDVVLAAGHQMIANIRSAYDDPTTLKEAVDHTEASLDAILDAVEKSS